MAGMASLFARTSLTAALSVALAVIAVSAQQAPAPASAAAPSTPPVAPGFDRASFSAMAWRNIGPFRGGRAVAVAGVPQQPRTF